MLRRVRPVRVKYVWFMEKRYNLHNRMQEPRGLSALSWGQVITKMRKSFEPVTATERIGCELVRVKGFRA